MSYCAGTNCNIADKCARHMHKDGLQEYVDWSQTGSGRADVNDCQVTYYCGDNSHNYPLFKSSFEPLDKYGKKISENDILLFDNGHRFKVIVINGAYCLLSLDVDLPLLLVDHVCVDNQFYSASKEGT